MTSDCLYNLLDEVEILYDGFREYFRYFNLKRNITMNHLRLEIEYVPIQYDLIDDDLDFDELYYEKIHKEFDRYLNIYLLSLFKKTSLDLSIEVNKRKEISRNFSIDYIRHEYSKNNDRIMHSITHTKTLPI